MENTLSTLGTVAEPVYRVLLREIEDGGIPVHARLPTERELCERFQVSRVTVRRVLQRLSEEGRVASKKGSGSHVCPPKLEQSTCNTLSLMCGSVPPDLPYLSLVALQHGCTLGIYAQRENQYDKDLERLFLERVKQQRHRALLAICTPLQPTNNDDMLQALCESGTRVVHMEPYEIELPRQNYLLPDYRRAGRAAATHLISKGFQKVVFVNMPIDAPSYRLVGMGVEEVTADQGIGRSPATFLTDDPELGTRFYQLPRDHRDHQKRWDELAALLREPTGFVVAGLNRATELHCALHRPESARRLKTEVVGIEIAPGLNYDFAYGEVLTFNWSESYRRTIELVTRPDFSGIHEFHPPIWAPRKEPLLEQGNMGSPTLYT